MLASRPQLCVKHIQGSTGLVLTPTSLFIGVQNGRDRVSIFRNEINGLFLETVNIFL